MKRRRYRERPSPIWRALLAVLLVTCAATARAERIRVPVQGPAGEIGRWLAPVRWHFAPSHAAVLPTGKVLLFGPPPEAHDGLVARAWNPIDGSLDDVSWDHHIHCSGHSFLADGSLYLTGGHRHDLCPTQGRDETNLFDPFTQTWMEMDRMRMARYYPTNLTLGDGRVLILAGLGDACQFLSRLEIYDPGRGLRLVRGERRRLDLYPLVHLLPDGRAVHVAPEPLTALLDPDRGDWTRIAKTLHGKQRLVATSFEIPGEPDQIVVCGGFERLIEDPTESCEVISLKGRNPSWRSLAPMRFPRGHANSVLLPDGTVLMVGGGGHGFHDDPVLNPELFDPEAGSWRLLPPQRHGRTHHSVAVLLPDGRVLSASEPPGENHHEDGEDHAAANGSTGDSWAEIYRPPYLFRGPRPIIRRAPERASYGETFEIRVQQAARVTSVVLIRPSAVTHSVNTEQRLVKLEFSRSRGKWLEVTLPRNPNRAPPGYYMLFAVNRKGVPSKAAMLQVLPDPPGEGDAASSSGVASAIRNAGR